MPLTENEMSRIKKILLEDDVQYFTDDDIQFYVDENKGNIDCAIYQMLIIKSEDTTISVSGLSTTSTSSYKTYSICCITIEFLSGIVILS